MGAPTSMTDLTILTRLLSDIALEDERERCESSLECFLESAWPHFEATAYARTWHIDAVCEHLEAVSYGEIDKLVINIPPRHGKTSMVVIAWPCWTWALEPDRRYPRIGAQVRFLCGAYGARKAQQDGVTARRLIGSLWYQRLWGARVMIAPDRDNAENYDNLAGGSRINTGIPESLGKGGLIRLLDDPQKTDEVESELVRESVIRAYDEVWSTRSNDPKSGAEVIIMQRLGENDLTGHVLERHGWTHLMLPAEYDASRHCVTMLGVPGEEYEWHDPRGCDTDGDPLPPEERAKSDGEPLWSDRFDENWCKAQAALVGPHAWAAQFQQSPVARGGNVIKSEWWRLWELPKNPDVGTVVVSLDGAYGLKRTNDYSAVTVWGAFPGKRGEPLLILLDAWRDRLAIHDLVQRLIKTCTEREADYLLIEGKGPGLSVSQEIRRLMGSRRWLTVLVDPEGQDKLARLQRVQALFANGAIWAPDTEWAQMVIDEVSSFPRAKHDDLTDSTSQALNWMRRSGVALTREEHLADEDERLRYRRAPEPLYDV